MWTEVKFLKNLFTNDFFSDQPSTEFHHLVGINFTIVIKRVRTRNDIARDSSFVVLKAVFFKAKENFTEVYRIIGYNLFYSKWWNKEKKIEA